MKRFNFRLQRVLDIRQKVRELYKLDLAKKASEYNLEIAKINKLKGEKKDAILEMKKTSSIEEKRLLDNYIRSNEEMQKYKMMDVKKKEKPFREALDKYLEKDREVKVLEKLRQRSVEEFRRASLKEDETVVDEIVSNSSSVKLRREVEQ
ncbi:MAG: flagellar export protein FliJ [Brevinematia bacterium]